MIALNGHLRAGWVITVPALVFEKEPIHFRIHYLEELRHCQVCSGHIRRILIGAGECSILRRQAVPLLAGNLACLASNALRCVNQ